jgi:hypothetical protein
MSKQRLQHQKLLEAIQFSERLIDINLWIQKAEELQAAAAVLEVDIRLYWSEIQVKDNHAIQESNRKYVQGPYSMLMAYAIENYFKAILIHRDADLQRNRMAPNLPTYIKKHDLVKLANTAKVTLDLSEEELLNRLWRYSTWAARYPVPTSPEALTTMQKLSDGKTYLAAYLDPHDIDRINKFIVRIRNYVNSEIQNSQ